MFKQAILASVVVLASAGAHAASATLTVTGTITPAACTISLGNNGNVDYGDISVETVKSYDLWFGTHYKLPPKQITFNIICPSPARVALGVTDNKAASKDATLSAPDLKFGLGGPVGTGFYELEVKSIQTQATRDASPTNSVSVLASNAPGDWFRQSGNVAGTFLSQNYRVAYTTGTGTRAADISSASNLTGTVEVQPKIKKSVVDNASSTIALDGSTELTVIYP